MFVLNQSKGEQEMKKEIKVLVKNESKSYSSESVLFGVKKFKIEAENENSYSHLSIYAYTMNGDLRQVANEYDIPNYEAVSFLHSDNERLLGNRKNIKVAEEYIRKVFND